MKLHLGCGQSYLQGYVNIDYPSDQHTIQLTTVADKFADITKLRYSENTIEEVRLHHVFEHFPRAQAIALFACWHSWLKRGGMLTIEVPDFDTMALMLLNPLSPESTRKVALRHIFGSQEAGWAVHYDGWSKRRLSELAAIFDMEYTVVPSKSHKLIHNVILTATKRKHLTVKSARIRAARYLSKFQVDDSDTEKRMHMVWLEQYDEQIKKSWAK